MKRKGHKLKQGELFGSIKNQTAAIKAINAAMRDMVLFGSGMIEVRVCRGKRKIKHIRMDRPAPDFDEPTQRDMNRYLTTRPCKRRNTR